MSGGEDYELLIAVPPRGRRALTALARAAAVPLTRIGGLTEDRALVLRRDTGDETLPAGFAHFG
jgi:thiamine-monophosphate kinase